ncbi:MAG: hypothetical protein ACRYFX_09880 [Janthinobacterium lividum]
MFRVLVPLTPVEKDMPLCNLGHLFNAYQSRLSGQEVLATPQESLREYHRLTVGPLGNLPKADRGRARAVRGAQQHLYTLAVLTNALHDMHVCVVAACNCLGELFTDYEGDLHRYAIANRLRRVAESVPGDDEEMAEWAAEWPEEYAVFQDEWEPNPEAGADGPTYRVKYKDDEQSLASYTLLTEITYYFAPLHEHTHIEALGSSFPEDFAFFTEQVRTYSEGHKTSHIGNLGMYRPNAAGEMEKLTYADRVESELNEKLKDERVASHFNQLLRRMHYAAGLSAMLTDAASYRELLDELVAIRDCTGLKEPDSLLVF